jgi:flagellar motor protein MotB
MAMSTEEKDVYNLDDWCPIWQKKAQHDRALRLKRERVLVLAARAAQQAAATAHGAAGAAWIACEAADASIEELRRRTAATAARRSSVSAQQASAAGALVDSDMSHLLARLAARRSSAVAAAAAAGVAGVGPRLDAIIQPMLVQYLQDLVMEEVGDGCPEIDIHLPHKRIDMRSPLSFEGGAAAIAQGSMSMVRQIQKAVRAIYTNIAHVNDMLERYGEPRTFEMPHLRVEGHVHKNPKSSAERSMGISQDRADALVGHVVAGGVPKRYLHPRGYGAEVPLGDAAQNRCVNRERKGERGPRRTHDAAHTHSVHHRINHAGGWRYS